MLLDLSLTIHFSFTDRKSNPSFHQFNFLLFDIVNFLLRLSNVIYLFPKKLEASLSVHGLFLFIYPRNVNQSRGYYFLFIVSNYLDRIVINSFLILKILIKYRFVIFSLSLINFLQVIWLLNKNVNKFWYIFITFLKFKLFLTI